MKQTMNIDFDDASKEWRKNKKYIGKGKFVYCCLFVHTKTKKQCRRTIVANLPKFYIIDFGGTDSNFRFNYHKNRHVFCKRHLNRYVNLT